MRCQTPPPAPPPRKERHCQRGCLKEPETVEYARKQSQHRAPPAPPEAPKARVIGRSKGLLSSILMCYFFGAIFGAVISLALVSFISII